jgi:hypothetical protein
VRRASSKSRNHVARSTHDRKPLGFERLSVCDVCREGKPKGLVLIYNKIYNLIVKRSARRAAQIDRLAKFSGPIVTVAASLPKELADAIRALVGKREFSRFVGEALARELVDRERAAYVDEAIARHGPLDQNLVAELEELFRR